MSGRRGVVYRELEGFRPLELDVYEPDGIVTATVVHVHGGGWRRGSRHHTLPALGEQFYERLAAQGLVVAAVDYRLSGEATYPAAVEDVAAAVEWARANGGPVIVWGDSAGGHLALLAALTGAPVSGVVAWFPVTDLVGLLDDVAAAGGTPERGADSREAQFLGATAASVPELARAASPLTHASASSPPVLLMHGTADDLVPPAQSERLASALKDAGAAVELELVPGASHLWRGATDVEWIVRRSVDFVRACA